MTESDPRVGTTVGPFRLLAVIGSGGMGVVYRAVDTRLERVVALKLVRADVTFDDDRRKRFLREARVAAALSHPGIARIFEIGETSDGLLYIAMELVEGHALRDVLAGTPLAVDRAIAIATDIARALGAAHERQIVHRDVKPENVMVTTDGTVKVLDFGIAKALEAHGSASTEIDTARTHTGQALGTPEYMAPEQARGAPVDARADVFALGVVLYEMLAGRRPFAGNTPVAVLLEIMMEDAVPLRSLRTDVPEALALIVERCLEKAPANRFESADRVADALATLRRTPQAATPEFLPTIASPSNGVQAMRPRRDWIWVLAAVALAAVTAVTSLLARMFSPAPSQVEQRTHVPDAGTPSAASSRPAPRALFLTGPLVEREVLVPDDGHRLGEFSLSSHAQRLAYLRGDGELHLLDLVTREDRQIGLPRGEKGVSVVFPEGSEERLLVGLTGAGGDRVVELELDTGRLETLFARASAADRSADGAYDAVHLGRVDVVVRRAENGRQVAAMPNVVSWVWGPTDATLYALQWSPETQPTIFRLSAPDFDPTPMFSSFRLWLISAPSAPTELHAGLLVPLTDPPPLLPGTSFWLYPYDGAPPRPVARLPEQVSGVDSTRDGSFVVARVTYAERDVRVATWSGDSLSSWQPVVADGHAQLSPWFLDDERLMFVTDKRGRFEIMQTTIGTGASTVAASGANALGAPVATREGDIIAWDVEGPDAAGQAAITLVRLRAGRHDELRERETFRYTVGTPRPTEVAVRCSRARCIVARRHSNGLTFETLAGDLLAEIADRDAQPRFAIDAAGRELTYVSNHSVVRVDLTTFTSRRQMLDESVLTQHLTYVGPTSDLVVSGASTSPPSYRVYLVRADGTFRSVYSDDDRWVGEIASSPDGRTVAVSAQHFRSEIARVLVPMLAER